MQAATVVWKNPPHEERTSCVQGAAYENAEARGGTFKRRRGARYAKLESVLVVTGGELDAMAWLMATGTPHLPHARSDPAPSVPPRLGLFAISLSLLHPATSLPLLPNRGSRKASSSVECKGHGVRDWGAAIALPLRTAQANAIAAAEQP